jgi:hypothetical protein
MLLLLIRSGMLVVKFDTESYRRVDVTTVASGARQAGGYGGPWSQGKPWVIVKCCWL